MQFINKLSKNLGQGQGDVATPKENSVETSPSAAEQPHAAPKYIYSIVIISIIALIVLITYLNWRQRAKIQGLIVNKLPPIMVSNDKLATALQMPTIPAAALANVATPANLTALIQAVNVSGDLKNTRLSLFLNKTVLFSVSRDNAQNSLTLFLENSQLAEPLLPLNLKNTLITDLQVNNVGNQLRINLKLAPDAQINQMQFVKSATPQLILDLMTNKAGTISLVRSADKQTLSADALISTNTLNKPGLEALANDQAATTNSSTVEKTLVPLTAEQRAEQSYQAALDAVAKDQPVDAIRMLTDLLKLYPAHTNAREALVTLLLRQNQTAQAMQLLQAGLQLQPGFPNFILLQAKILLAQGNVMAALDKIQSTKPELTDYPEYYAFAAALYQRTGTSAKAVSIYSQLVELYPNNSIWWMGLGISLENTGKKQMALEAYQTALANKNLSFELQNYVSDRISALGG